MVETNSRVFAVVCLYILISPGCVQFNCGVLINDREERAIGDCGGSYVEDTGFITSPSYPYNYERNVDCEYYISVSDGYIIHLVFTEFYLATHGDHISVYDGPSQFKPNGNYEDRIIYKSGTKSDITEVIISTDVNITVLFDSGSSSSYPGFYATWTAIYDNTMGVCGSTYAEDEGTITSPGYPDDADYGNNEDCYFYITTSSGNKIQLMFYSLNTEADKDMIEVYDGDGLLSSAILVGTYSGTDRPPVITSSGNSLTVHFTSDYLTTNDGFYALYNLAPSSETSVCHSGVGSITSMGGTIISHYGYPSDYSSPQTCVLTLTNFEQYNYIYIKFTEIDVYGCGGGDYITVDGDNELLGTLCESSHVGTEFTSSTLITITFNAESHTGTYQGFKAVYSLYYRTSYSSDTCDYSTDFKCDNGNCIDSSLRSDGYDHCGDNSDENSSSSSSSSSSDTLIIVGVVIGVIVLLVIIIGVIFYWVQSKKSSATSPAGGGNASAFAPTPVGGLYQPPEAKTDGNQGGAPPPYSGQSSNAAPGAAPNPYYNASEVPNPYAHQSNQGGYNPNMAYNPSEPAKGNDVKPPIE